MNDEKWLAPTTRTSFFPIQYPIIYDFWKLAKESMWDVGEIKDLFKDADQFNSFDSDKQTFLLHILAFFASVDYYVGGNIFANFGEEISIPEIKAWYAAQNYIEQIHSEMYSILIDTLVKDTKQRQEIFGYVERIPTIKKKEEWITKYMNPNVPFAHRLFGFAIIEGVYFSGSFCAIWWFKKQGEMPGLVQANNLIARDEGMHVDFAEYLYNGCNNRLSEKDAYQIMDEAVNIEIEFINDALKCNLIGMNARLMTIYIQFVADDLLTSMGYSKKYNVKNPFDWVVTSVLKRHDNFFERGISDYSLNRVDNDSDDDDF